MLLPITTLNQWLVACQMENQSTFPLLKQYFLERSDIGPLNNEALNTAHRGVITPHVCSSVCICSSTVFPPYTQQGVVAHTTQCAYSYKLTYSNVRARQSFHTANKLVMCWQAGRACQNCFGFSFNKASFREYHQNLAGGTSHVPKPICFGLSHAAVSTVSQKRFLWKANGTFLPCAHDTNTASSPSTVRRKQSLKTVLSQCEHRVRQQWVSQRTTQQGVELKWK